MAVGIGIFETITNRCYRYMTKASRMELLQLELGMQVKDVDALQKEDVTKRMKPLYLFLHPDKNGSSVTSHFFQHVRCSQNDLLKEIEDHQKSLAHKAWDFTKEAGWNIGKNVLVASFGLIGQVTSWAMGRATQQYAIVSAKPWWKFW